MSTETPPAMTPMPEPVKILVRLKEGYGGGDAIQTGVVLKHLAKYRPNWIVDFQCRRGWHTVGTGICNAVFTDDEPATGKYHQVIDCHPHDAIYNWDDRPNTKVTSMLHEVFGLPYDPELGRYSIHVSEPVKRQAMRNLANVCMHQREDGRFHAVIIHYQGGSSPHRKNLDHWQAQDICAMVTAAGRVPIILDRDKQCPFVDGKTIHRIGADGADGLAALISQVEAYVGIDSGPGHAASATDTPTLICWTKNHPVHFHDPAPNTVHLIPENHRSMQPADNDGVLAYFMANYVYDTYVGDNGLVSRVHAWLADTLRCHLIDAPPMTFVIRHDRLAVALALCKIRSVAQGRPIDVILDGTVSDENDSPLRPLLKQFPFIRSVKIERVGLQPPDRPVNTRGQRIFASDGRHDGDNRFFLVPEAAVEQGKLLSQWLLDYEIDLWLMNNDEVKSILEAK